MQRSIGKFLKSNEAARNLVLALLALLLGVVGLEQFAPSAFSRIEEVLSDTQPGFYEVVEVNDGDTITVRANGRDERVRFIGIDTPEKNHPSKPVQCFAEAASERMTQLIGTNSVGLEADPLNSNRDRYDRLLRYVYLEDGRLLNRVMIEEGYAFAYLAFPFSHLEEFERLENEAREANRGLWRECEILEEGGSIETAPDV